ncbi:sulfur carrier protein [Rhodococcus sp. 27YEA15]|uniref:sulfur carrier protein ThiS n=1 Tax=Rhodococcus sp. 27YEA15 TaxID=3156259 RepID=UPI003C7CE8C9
MSEQIPIGITVNGEDLEFPQAVTVSDLLVHLSLPTKGIAVAIDGALFPRGRWSESVERGANIEILTAVQGG